VVERERPQVVISDPARPGPHPPAPVRALPDPPARAGPRRALVVVVVAGLVAAAGVSVTRQREAARQERRDSALSLRVQVRGQLDLDRRRDGTVLLQVPLSLTNAGPRPVTVLGLQVAGTGMQGREDVPSGELAPGQELRLRAAEPVTCPPRPPDAGAGQVLQLSARSGSRPSSVRVRLPAGLLAGAVGLLDRACGGGVRPGEELALDLSTLSRVGPDTLLLSLQVSNRTSAPLRVLRAVSEQQGLLASPRVGTLPRDVPAERFPRVPSGPGSRPVGFGLVLQVAPGGCGTLREAAERPPAPGGEQPLVSLVVDAGQGSAQRVLPVYADDGDTVRQLAGSACR